MKTLKESILDNEDVLMDTMGDDIMSKKILKICNRILNGPRLSKIGTDMCGHKVNVGDAVFAMLDSIFIAPGLIFNISEDGTKCNIIFCDSDLEKFKQQKINYYNYEVNDIIKVDKDTMLKILK